MSKSKIQISALILTFNRTSRLEQSIESLVQAKSWALDHGLDLDLEIIIQVNGQDLASEALVEQMRKQYPREAITLGCSSERKYPGEARNEALKLTKDDGDRWLFFIDDDAFVGKDFFLLFASAVSVFPKATVFGGPNINPPDSSHFQKASGLALSSRMASFLSAARYKDIRPFGPCGEESLILCNLLIRRGALEDKPFPERFICNEENWVLQTLKKRGDQLIYVPFLKVFHERRKTPISFSRQIFKYGCGRGQNIVNRPWSISPIHIFPSICLVFSLLALLLGSANPVLFQIWMSLMGLYAIMCFVAALRSSVGAGFRVFFTNIFMFPLIHLFYGSGVFWGIFRLRR